MFSLHMMEQIFQSILDIGLLICWWINLKLLQKITLTKTSEKEKCTIESDKDMNLKNLGLFLGFTKNKVI